MEYETTRYLFDYPGWRKIFVWDKHKYIDKANPDFEFMVEDILEHKWEFIEHCQDFLEMR